MINLYPHQEVFINEIKSQMGSYKKILGQAQTGFGKTICMAYIIYEAIKKGKKIIITVHRRTLINQTSNTLNSFGIEHSFIAAGLSHDPLSLVQIASIDTLKARLDRIEYNPDLIMVDEAHFSKSLGWSKVINHFIDQGAWLLGMTATPWRLDGSGLGDIYDTMVCGPSTRWLIDNKYLSDYKYYAPTTLDLTSVKKTSGDYNQKELADLMEGNKSVIGDAVDNYLKYAKGKRMIAFCCTIDHSLMTAAKFNASGIRAAHIDGSTDEETRHHILNKYADGEIDVVCNVGIFCEGFDLSAQIGRDVTVEGVILLRPTKSLSLYLQQVGRALRKKPYAAIILDHCGNYIEHGLPDDDREWSLESIKKAKRNNVDSGPPIRRCDHCLHVQKPAPVCKYCGTEFQKTKKEIKEEEGELIEIERARIKKQMKTEVSKARDMDSLLAIQKERGYKSGWARAIYYSRKRR